jgi:hypothetical protein
LAPTAVVHSILERLQDALPTIIPRREKELVSMLRAARHIQRYSATDTKRGCPSLWKREELLRVAASLGAILERETSAHI